MEQFNWETAGQLVGSLLLLTGAAIAVVKGHSKSDGTPPQSRDPDPNEIREALKEIKALVRRHKEIDSDSVHHIERQLDYLIRGFDRVEAAIRFEDAARRWTREAEDGRDQYPASRARQEGGSEHD